MKMKISFVLGSLPAFLFALIGSSRWQGGTLAVAILGTWIVTSLGLLAVISLFTIPWRKHGVTWLRVFWLIILVQGSFALGFCYVRDMYYVCFALASAAVLGLVAWYFIKRSKRAKTNAEKASEEMREAVFELTCR